MISTTSTGRPHRVVILGGGFAGIIAARTLRNASVEITLINRTNHHLFQPLLYQVATAVLAPSDITSPIRFLLRSQQNTTVLIAEARSIDNVASAMWKDNLMLPGVAPAANQMGRLAAKNVLRTLKGEPRKTLRYVNKGNLATIGRNRAVADFGKLRVAGRMAWFLWLFVHILYLVGFRNRMSVLGHWIYAFATYRRAAHLIDNAERYAPVPPAAAGGPAAPGPDAPALGT